MKLLRIREYGSADWTQIEIDGELEDHVGRLLEVMLREDATLHAQERVEGEWEAL